MSEMSFVFLPSVESLNDPVIIISFDRSIETSVEI